MKPRSPRAKGPVLPPPTHLCQCYDCINDTCTDPLSGFLIQGRWVDKATLSQHDSLTRSRGIASAKSAAAAIGILRPTFAPPQSPTLSQFLNQPVHTVAVPSEVAYGIPPSRPNLIREVHLTSRSSYPQAAAEAGSRKRKDDRKTSQSYRSGAADALAAIQRLKHVMEASPKFDFKSVRFSRLPTSSHADQRTDPEDFWNLESGIAANVQLLTHQSWMLESQKFVSDMVDQYGRYSTSLRLSSTILKRLISEELESLEQSLRAEWERQRWVAVEAPATYVDMSKPLSHLYPYFSCTDGKLRS